ncbi:MAG: acetone carboxylase subunit gamma [Thermodesulfobacteriota bacterium]
MPTYDDAVIADLMDGKLDWLRTKEIISNPKDPERFDQVIGILQQRMSWPEKILLPLAEHLYIVQKGADRIVKCDCGFEFGDYHQNWKHQARVFVRDTEALLQELYRPFEHSHPDWMELREFYCPGCLALLEVEAAPPGYPVIFDFRPDLEAFYREVLNRNLPAR